jgi:hypothetical protein
MLNHYEIIEEKYPISQSTIYHEQKNRKRSLVIYTSVFGFFAFFGIFVIFMVGLMVCERDSLLLAGL